MESLLILGTLGFALDRINQYKEHRAQQKAMQKLANTHFAEYQREDERETSDILVLNDADSLQDLAAQNEGYLSYVGDYDFLFGPNNELDHHNLINTYSPPTFVPDHFELV